jgi:hypothetical protein
MSEWQPIETAPRDGTEFLLYAPDSIINARHYLGVGQWAEPNGMGSIAGWFWPYAIRPSHWMPLPSPPKGLRETP